MTPSRKPLLRKILLILLRTILPLSLWASQRMPERELISFDDGWFFAFGHAADPAKDFGCGTEYFNYLTKAASMHNEGPYADKFDASAWQPVTLPHDWAVSLPFAPEASHSHGYKKVGWKYPATSVGWYRKTFRVSLDDEGRHFTLRFDGIFRNAQVWLNGFLLGQQASGYLPHVYDISDLLRYDGTDNVVAVRADASLEEGWFYEGAGIYRHAWLEVSDPLHVETFGTFAHATFNAGRTRAALTVETTVRNSGSDTARCQVRQHLIDASGREVASELGEKAFSSILPQASSTFKQTLEVERPNLWSCDTPYLYTIRTEVVRNGQVVDAYTTPFGFRTVEFTADSGLLLNGERVELRGVNMHQDHAGVGAAIPDSLQAWRLRKLKELGVNAYRCSHNPPNPVVLDLCDRMGLLVIAENRVMGTNEAQLGQLRQMIVRDRNHPCVVLWSIGNEEWALENTETGRRVAQTMAAFANRIDPTRLTTAANAGGNRMLEAFQVVGYNYLAQNPIDQYRKDFPQRTALGSEETTGCGTRGIYFDDRAAGRMKALNRGTEPGVENVIERGWTFYATRPWLAGLFYWTGFDYRGEPNPLSYPATGSSFGVLDYCGFPKDEAFYLKAMWTEKPVLHIFPHWNLAGHEGDTLQVWAYTNCDEVELFLNNRSQGRQRLAPYSHLSWPVAYQPGKLRAVGYKNGRKVAEEKVETTDAPAAFHLTCERASLSANAADVAVVTLSASDRKGRHVPDACNEATLTLTGPAQFVGWGNGDSAFRQSELPATPDSRTLTIGLFNGYAQILIRRTADSGDITLRAEGETLKPSTIIFK